MNIPISYLSNFYCLTWKIPWRPLSNGKSVWLRQTIIRWTDNWMTSSILSSFLLKVNIASLLSFKYFVSVSISSRSEIRMVGSLLSILLAISFLVSFAFSPEIAWSQFLSVNELSWSDLNLNLVFDVQIRAHIFNFFVNFKIKLFYIW